jgi:hypothetical protein
MLGQTQLFALGESAEPQQDLQHARREGDQTCLPPNEIGNEIGDDDYQSGCRSTGLQW